MNVKQGLDSFNQKHNKHFLLTCKPLVVMFGHGPPAREMSGSYKAKTISQSLSISLHNHKPLIALVNTCLVAQ